MKSSEQAKATTPSTAPLRHRTTERTAPALERDRSAAVLGVQRISGNEGLTQLLGRRQLVAHRAAAGPKPVPVQRKLPSIGGLTKTLGLGKKETAAAAAEKAANKAGAANVSGAKDVEKQLARLEAATAGVVKARAAFKAKNPNPDVQDQENELAAFAVKKAAERILGPGQGSKATQLLVGATPEQAQRLRKVIDDNLAIYGVVKADSVATAGEKAAGAARKANIRTMGDLEEQVSTLRTATMKLRDAHTAGNAESQMAALQIKRAAERILGNEPKRGSDQAQELGPSFPEQLRWLQWVIDETQLIYDEVRVEMTKRQADNIYLEAGRQGLGSRSCLQLLAGQATPSPTGRSPTTPFSKATTGPTSREPNVPPH